MGCGCGGKSFSASKSQAILQRPVGQSHAPMTGPTRYQPPAHAPSHSPYALQQPQGLRKVSTPQRRMV